MALGEHGIDCGEDRDRRADRHAAHCTCGDEGRRMFDSENDVSGAGGRRQCRDQCADERTGALNHDRNEDDDGRRHCHLENEFGPE